MSQDIDNGGDWYETGGDSTAATGTDLTDSGVSAPTGGISPDSSGDVAPPGGSSTADFVALDDNEELQAVVLAAAINGNAVVSNQLPSVVGALEEPYRTIAATFNAQQTAGGYIDRVTLSAALAGQTLYRRTSSGAQQQLTAAQAVNLVLASEVQPGQAEAYLQVLEGRLREKMRIELKERATALAREYGDQPERLLAEIEQLHATARRNGVGSTPEQPCELEEIIPFVQELAARQCGTDFIGLDSGFPHFNRLTNGLDTGLVILAAPPGRGKTTLALQIACQVAEIGQLPVIFVSMEQSKQDLRVKTLARFSGLEYRHILRGRLRSDDPSHMETLLRGATRLALLGRHLTIVEGDSLTTVDAIQQIAQQKLAAAQAQRCFIVVDYLQILPLRQEDTGRVTNTRDRVDLQVSALRRLARQLNSPVLVISAENRAGYQAKRLDVFKESGGIEYSADIAMVLMPSKQQPAQGAGGVSLDLNILKNRNGERGVVKFNFYAARAEFVETGREDFDEESKDE